MPPNCQWGLSRDWVGRLEGLTQLESPLTRPEALNVDISRDVSMVASHSGASPLDLTFPTAEACSFMIGCYCDSRTTSTLEMGSLAMGDSCTVAPLTPKLRT